MIYELQSLDKFEVPGRGLIYLVENPFECNHFDHLIGQIQIDGMVRTVTGIERCVHTPPCRKGEKIGLLVQGETKDFPKEEK